MSLREPLEALQQILPELESRLVSEGHLIECSAGDLSWKRAGKGFRICLGDRPLIEARVEDRLRGARGIRDLVIAIRAASKNVAEEFGAVLEDLRLL